MLEHYLLSPPPPRRGCGPRIARSHLRLSSLSGRIDGNCRARLVSTRSISEATNSVRRPQLQPRAEADQSPCRGLRGDVDIVEAEFQLLPPWLFHTKEEVEAQDQLVAFVVNVGVGVTECSAVLSRVGEVCSLVLQRYEQYSWLAL